MYITRVEIENIKCFKHLVWEIDAGDAAGWHVILGDNGTGKSAFVKALALGLLGAGESLILKLEAQRWMRNADQSARIVVEVRANSDFDRFPRNVKTSTDDRYTLLLKLSKIQRKGPDTAGEYEDDFVLSPMFSNPSDPNGHIWKARLGWFSASYGPYRRFTGANRSDEVQSWITPRFACHITLFRESAAMTGTLDWLKQLQFEKLEDNSNSDQLLGKIITFINQNGFLPNNILLNRVTSSGVHFQTADGYEILIEDLSDGYRSILALTFELLRQLSGSYGFNIFETHLSNKVTVKVPGVVLIDEVDAHLHPTWQKEIGFWFREHFPNIQFVVTTHSPLVCQAAEKGTIFQLPKPGTEEQGRFITGIERDRLLYGNILDAYSTEVFGAGVTQADATDEKLERLSELNSKEMYLPLTTEEKNEQERLRAMLPTSASILTPK